MSKSADENSKVFKWLVVSHYLHSNIEFLALKIKIIMLLTKAIMLVMFY